MASAQPTAPRVSFPVVPPSAPPAPADRFACLIDGLCRGHAARGAGIGLAGPLIALLWSRLRRIAVRFARLAERVRAGTLAAAAPPPARPAQGPAPAARLPRGFAWLVRRLPQAASAASQLQHLLADPAMAELIAAAPQAGRLLRPLCRMLGVRPPPAPSLSSGRPAGPVGPPPPIRPAVPPRPPSRARPRPSLLTPPLAPGTPPVRV